MEKVLLICVKPISKHLRVLLAISHCRKLLVFVIISFAPKNVVREGITLTNIMSDLGHICFRLKPTSAGHRDDRPVQSLKRCTITKTM